MPTLWLGERQIRYTVLPGKSRKYTYLRFRSDLTLEIISPSGGKFSLDSLLRKKEGWIRRKYEELSRNNRTVTDESLMFDGKSLRLVFVKSADREALLPLHHRLPARPRRAASHRDLTRPAS